MADDLPTFWSERAIARDRRFREELERRAREDLLGDKQQQEKDNDFIMNAAEAIMAAQERREALQERIDNLDGASLQALLEAQERLDQIRESANRAKDGRRVYEAADGTIYDEDGNEVDRDAIDFGMWRDDGSSWEKYKDRAGDVEEITEYRRRLHEQQERLEQEPDTEELDDIDRELAELEEDMPESIKRRYELANRSPEQPASRTTSVAKTLDGPQDNALTLRGLFFAAATGTAAEPADDRPDMPFRPGPFTPA